jgi:dTDP-4-amino-4,6-dideoxygalactose transaminase
MSTDTPIPFVDLAAQRESIGEALETALLDAARRTDWILGESVREFELAFARYCEVDLAVGMDTGLSALELALRSCGVGPGDEVITQANTFVATALAISHTGATPVLVDAEAERQTLDPALIEAAITPRTRAIVPVHLYGQPADMDPILEIAERHGLFVVEDACQAHGARYKGKRAGSLGHAAAFSFYPAKNLGALGDGGMLVTDDAGIAERARMLRDYGQSEKYVHQVKGFNHRLDTLQAAVLLVKLPHLDAWNEARRATAALYDELLSDLDLGRPATAVDVEHVWHLYVVETDNRADLQGYLKERGISTGIHYPIPVHLQPAYADLGYRSGSFPVTEAAAPRILSLPMFPELQADAARRVVDAMRVFLDRAAAPERLSA